jgi:hypothetical protein
VTMIDATTPLSSILCEQQDLDLLLDVDVQAQAHFFDRLRALKPAVITYTELAAKYGMSAKFGLSPG